jgi:uncharacterized BrkB/YihY/UPF0761 family membrane protein
MEQAASHIQDSMDLPFPRTAFLSALFLLNFFFTATYLVLPSTRLPILDVLNELIDMHTGANPRESPL